MITDESVLGDSPPSVLVDDRDRPAVHGRFEDVVVDDWDRQAVPELVKRVRAWWAGPVAVATVAAVAAVPAHAAWQGSMQIGAASAAPILAFGPGGDAAIVLGDESTPGSNGDRVYLIRRAAFGGFGQAELVSSGSLLPQSLALPGRGAIVMMLENLGVTVTGFDALVKPAGSGSFLPPQQLSGYMPQTPFLAADARGGVVASLTNYAGSRDYVRTLGPGRVSFGQGLYPWPSLSAPYTSEDDQPAALLAPDGAGGMFAAVSYASTSSVRVAYRRPGGAFGLGRIVGAGGETGVALGAGGSGRAAVVLVRSLFGHPRLFVALGGRRGFGRQRLLASVLPPPLHSGLVSFSGESAVVSRNGAAAIAWQQCGSLPSCTIRAAFADSRGRFTGSQTLGTAPSSTATMAGDQLGDLVIAWENANDQVVGAVRPTGARFFGRPIVLSSAPARSATPPSVAFGQRGEALVAWAGVQALPGQQTPVLSDVYRVSH